MAPRKDAMKASVSKVLQRLKAQIGDILADKPVMIAYLYGSMVKGDSLPSSDIDIGLVLEPNCAFSAYERMELEFDISAEVERRCGVREADVRSIDIAPLTVQGKVVSEGILLFSRDEEFRVEYEVRTRKLYFDFLPVMEMMRATFFEHFRVPY